MATFYRGEIKKYSFEMQILMNDLYTLEEKTSINVYTQIIYFLSRNLKDMTLQDIAALISLASRSFDEPLKNGLIDFLFKLVNEY